MYSVYVKDSGETVASSVFEGLAEAVSFGREESLEGNSITVYAAVQDASGNIMHLNKVLSMIMPKETPYV
jgi:hypothetical protein